MIPPKPGGSHPPADPLFDAVGHDLRARAKAAVAELKKHVGVPAAHAKAPKTPFTPHLLIRSFAGDHGDRPGQPPPHAPNAPALGGLTAFSPDIWLRDGYPRTNPDLPPPPSDSDLPDSWLRWPFRAYVAVHGLPHTVYAHVWNLGLAPAGRARVEFAWVPDATVGIEQLKPIMIGVELVDLLPRVVPGCHALVKCATPWIPKGAALVSAIVVRVSALGDPVGSDHPWQPVGNRHVAAHAAEVLRGIAIP